jgi:3'-phosphoadenosine 5'-phosphosulfate sulfotransferase (PAPS reductase)/FAD synthetase
MNDNIIQVSFSGGRSSAMMAKIMLDNYDRDRLIFMFANTGKEMPQTLDFVHDCDAKWNLGVVWIEYDKDEKFRVVSRKTASEDGRPFAEMVEKRKYLPNTVKRFCTSELKVNPMKKYLQSLGFKSWDCAIGIRYDEPNRYRKLKGNSGKDVWDYVFPLYDFKITKKQVFDFWGSQSFDLKIPSEYGNCDFCFMKGLAKKVGQARKMPERIDWWIEQEEKVKATFNKEYSCKTIKHLALQNELFTSAQMNEPEISCFCGD